MNFLHNWYSETQLGHLQNLAHEANQLSDGLFLEIGTWDGKSAIRIAQTITPRQLHCIDTWRGNEDESAVTGIEHVSVALAKEHNIYQRFLDNIEAAKLYNVTAYKMTWQYFAKLFEIGVNRNIAFLHIDASHDYESVKTCIETFKPYIIQGGIMCGDDYLTASENRSDLHGGVMRAVKEVLPEHGNHDNLWYYYAH